MEDQGIVEENTDALEAIVNYNINERVLDDAREELERNRRGSNLIYNLGIKAAPMAISTLTGALISGKTASEFVANSTEVATKYGVGAFIGFGAGYVIALAVNRTYLALASRDDRRAELIEKIEGIENDPAYIAGKREFERRRSDQRPSQSDLDVSGIETRH